MKKKVLSLLLVLVLVFSLFMSLSATALAIGPSGSFLVSYAVKAGDTLYAICEAHGIATTTENIEQICKLSNVTNANWIAPGNILWLKTNTASTSSDYYNLHSYTVQPGDTMASVCDSYGGVNFDRDYNLIAALNPNANFNSLIAGQNLTLPVYVKAEGDSSTDSDDEPATVITSGDATPAVPNGGAAPAAGDQISYYLVQHVIAAGDTVYDLCATYGLDFYAYYDTIVKLNPKVNFSWMLPGNIILFPSKTLPSTGSYYAVYAHPVAVGDTVYNLCAGYGLNYYTYADLICGLNNRTNLATFYPGETLYLPKYFARSTAPAAPAAPASPTPATPAEPAAPAAPATVITSGDATPASIPAEDDLNSLLVMHSLQPGETVSGVLAGLGIADSWELDQKIMKYSNLTNLNWVNVGQLLYIPTTTYPAAGTPYYKIMAHELVSGDTVYGLCETYGLKYLDNVGLIQRLNGRDDLSTYYVGDTIYMPVLVQNPAE